MPTPWCMLPLCSALFRSWPYTVNTFVHGHVTNSLIRVVENRNTCRYETYCMHVCIMCIKIVNASMPTHPSCDPCLHACLLNQNKRKNPKNYLSAVMNLSVIVPKFTMLGYFGDKFMEMWKLFFVPKTGLMVLKCQRGKKPDVAGQRVCSRDSVNKAWHLMKTNDLWSVLQGFYPNEIRRRCITLPATNLAVNY